jgi:transcriptional regulator with XRE-family HTH domain
MLIGKRLREIREAKGISQVAISRATRLVPPYLSLVENGHTVPSLETLEKWAHALGIPLYEILYDGEQPPQPLKLSTEEEPESLWGDSEQEAQALNQLRRALSKMTQRKRKILLSLAQRMVSRSDNLNSFGICRVLHGTVRVVGHEGGGSSNIQAFESPVASQMARCFPSCEGMAHPT